MVSTSTCSMALPKISVITPTYNAEKTIIKCIESVAQQSYPVLEHWIIDGASSDHTLDLVIEASKKYVHIRYLSEKDEGIYDAMNKGIDMATGDWIYFLGSDDTFYDHHILKQIFSDADNSCDILYGNVKSTAFQNSSSEGVYGGCFHKQKLLQTNICHQAIFAKKELFSSIGKFDIRYKGHADWDFNLRWFLNEKIRHRYVDVIVANFATGGYSTQNQDLLFRQERWKKVLTYGYNTLSKKEKQQIFWIMFKEPLRKRNFLNLLSNLWFIIKYSF